MSPRRHLPAELARALELVAPGTDLREAIDNIMKAHNGALIVLDNPEKLEGLGIISGGMKVEVEFAPMRLYELAKMDGAIVVSPHISAIHYANAQLSLDPSLESEEARNKTVHEYDGAVTLKKVIGTVGTFEYSASIADEIEAYMRELDSEGRL